MSMAQILPHNVLSGQAAGAEAESSNLSQSEVLKLGDPIFLAPTVPGSVIIILNPLMHNKNPVHI